MANAKIDENYEGTRLATTDNVAKTTQPLLCEPILDYLEIDLAIVSSFTDVTVTTKEDENFESVALAYDAVNDVTRPLKVDPSTNCLIIDL